MQIRQTKTGISISILFFLLVCFIPEIPAADSSTLEQGITYYRQENFDEALPILQKARKEDPSSSLAAYYLGITYKQLQDYKRDRKTHV